MKKGVILMKTNSLTKVVKVMNFHALLNVDNAKAKADELMNVSTELTKLIQRIIYNKNLILDKNVLKPDPNKPKLSIYIASDLGFCGNFNNVINEQIRKEKDCYKIIIGKEDIKQPYSQSYPKHFMPKHFRLIVLPTGIKNGNKNKKEQNLPYSP